MRRYVFILACVLFFSPGCMMGQNKNEIWQNNKINQKTRAEVSELNKQAYKAISDNDYEALSRIESDSMKARVTNDFVKKFMPQIQGVVKGKKYTVFDEYYIKNIKPVDTVKLSSGKGDTAYNMKFVTKAKETYMTLMIAGDSVDEIMLTVTFTRINGLWKLDYISGEDYSLNRKNAIEQYYYAQTLQQNGSLIDAINAMSLCNHCLNPGGKSFKYDKEKEITKFSDTLTAETKAKYPLPYMIDGIATKPKVVNIHCELMNKKFVPMIIYQSEVNVRDSISLKKENDEIQKNIGEVFHGIDRDNKAIIYRTYNELPNGQNNPAYFGFIQNM